MVEQSAVNRSVVGSSPTSGAILKRLGNKGFLEQAWPLSVKCSRNTLLDETALRLSAYEHRRHLEGAIAATNAIKAALDAIPHVTFGQW